MAQTLDEQLVTVVRALGERMIDSALVVIRAWMNELGENNPYEEAHSSILKRYDELFSLWLTSDDEQIDEQLNALTGDAYQLMDAVYADLRLKRGLSPTMHGFNHDSMQSVLNYFLHCVRFRPEDLEWLHDSLRDEERVSVALMAVTALSQNLRQCFNTDGILALIDGMNVENDIVANQCTAVVLLLLLHYDIRIDFFKPVQDAFVEAIQEMGDGGERVVNVLGALIMTTSRQIESGIQKELASLEELPSELQKLIDEVGERPDTNAIIQWFPATEMEYMEELIHIMPDTWVFDVLTEENPEFIKALAQVSLKAGYRDALWSFPNMAERIYRQKLRKGSKNPQDYIDFAHCLLLKGDRMMAFENYRQARSMCKNVKDFYALYRPDRSALVEKGVPIEQVYLIEDQLFNV
jgi:hypothetical protein